MSLRPTRVLLPAAMALVSISGGVASAQFDPGQAQWGKLDPAHVRVMSYNIEDAICTTNPKLNTVGNWNALARVVATMKPDILILQEMGDNDGNGTGGGVDSVANLATTCRLFFIGGTDPFRGGAVTSYVQLFAPGYDLPYVFVSASHDGFNRNVILSRWPFADLNGDGVSAYSDIPIVSAPYTSGNGGIRGFQFAEINLPDDLYAGDLVIGNAHLKSGGGAGNENQRVTAGKNVGYFIDQFYNGAGSGVVDPSNTVLDNPPATSVLGQFTPVIAGGDWNQDENAPLASPSNLKGPARWITEGLNAGGLDGSDRDRSDMARDNAVRKVINFNGTVGNGSPLTNSVGKIDHVVYQDSIVTIASQFIFDAFELNGVFPPAVASYPGQPFNICKDASDHWPVTVDFVFAAPMIEPCPADLDGDGVVGASDLAGLLGGWGAPGAADLNGSGAVDSSDLAALLGAWGACP